MNVCMYVFVECSGPVGTFVQPVPRGNLSGAMASMRDQPPENEKVKVTALLVKLWFDVDQSQLGGLCALTTSQQC